MELEVPTQITYSLTHAQLNLLSVEDGDDESQLKGIATSVSTPAFISFSGFISSSVTILVTGPNGDTVDYKGAGGEMAGGEDDTDDGYDDGYAPVPELGYFSSCSSIDSLATLASHEDLATFASALLPPPPPPPPAITVTATAPVPGPTADADADGFDALAGPQQVQQMQQFLRFQEAQQARYAELFDNEEDDEEFDFFGYGRNFHDGSLEAVDEGEDTEEEVVEDDVAEHDEWVEPEELVHVPFLIPVIDVPFVHEPDARELIKETDATAEADKENHNPLDVTNAGAETERQVADKAAKDVKLSVPVTLELSYTPNSTLNLDFTLDGALDFGFDFGAVLDEVVFRAPSSSSTTDVAVCCSLVPAEFRATAISGFVTVGTPAFFSAPVATPNPITACTLSPALESQYSSPSVYSTESAPYSPYLFATSQPGQQSDSTTAPAPTLTTPPAGLFDAYDATCFDGLGFESLDVRLRADGSVQVVFDAGEDEGEAEAEAGGFVAKEMQAARENAETKVEAEFGHAKENERDEEQEQRGDDSFSRFPFNDEQGMKHGDNSDEIEIENGSDERADAEVQEVSMGDGKMNMNMTTPEEAFKKWRQACLALAAFAHGPVKTALLADSNSEFSRVKEARARISDDVLERGVRGVIEVYAVTQAAEAMEATKGDAIRLSGSESVSDDADDTATAFMSQPKIEPVVVPCALRESSLPEPAASLTAMNESEVAFEEDEGREVAAPTDDIVSYVYSIPGPECMPSFAAVITSHLSPAPAPAMTPASSFAIPVASSRDGLPLLSESAPSSMQSSSFDSFHVPAESSSLDMLGERSMSIDDINNMPSLLAEEFSLNALTDSSSTSSLFSEMVFPDDVDGPADSAMEIETVVEEEAMHTEREFLIEVGSPTADLSNVPLDTILEEPEENGDAECRELIKALAELESDFESDYDSDFGVDVDVVAGGNLNGEQNRNPSCSRSTLRSVITPSPLLAVYEELSGGPQHLCNSLPRYAMRSLDTLSHPWLSSLSSLSSLGRRSSTVSLQNQTEVQSSTGSTKTSPESTPISSGVAPAAASEDDGWSLVASPQPGSLSPRTPLRPSANFVATSTATSSPAIQKKHRSGFFMSRMTFCPSPSPKRTSAPPPVHSMNPNPIPAPPISAPAPAHRRMEKVEVTGTQGRSGGRIRFMLRKLRTFF